MAWPLTPLTTYVAGVTPYIKAADLNSIQSGINGIIGATYSLKSVVVDGTGGSVVVPVAGTAKVSATASAAGAGTAVAWGLMYKESALFGHMRVSSAGAITASFNGLSATRTAMGVYEVKFNAAPTNIARSVPLAVAVPGVVAAYIVVCQPPALSGADALVTVNTYDAAGAAADIEFAIGLFGG